MIDCTCRHADFQHDEFGCTALVCCDLYPQLVHTAVLCDCIASSVSESLSCR